MIIKTKSFELAIYQKGSENSEKLALVLPGKLDTKDYAHMRNHVEMLAGLGFYALSFDPPGTWESPGDISLYNTTNYLKAVDELIGYFGNKQTFLMGHSRGASIALIAGVKNKRVMTFCPIMPSFTENGFDKTVEENWKKSGYKLSKRELPPGNGEEVREFKLPYSFFEDQIKYEWSEEFTKCSKPKLVIIGKHDVTVPTDEVREIYKKLSEPKELYELDWDHNYRHSPEKIAEVNKVTENFLKKYSLI